ncbi:MAG: hypothetical protein V4525_10490 [Pseudomonadota bacterium]
MMLPDPRKWANKQSNLVTMSEISLWKLVENYITAPTQAEKDLYAEKTYAIFSELCAQKVMLNPDVLLNSAPSNESARTLVRLLQQWEVQPPHENNVGLRFFALPVIIVAGAERVLSLRAVLRERDKVEAILRDKQVLGNAEQWGLSNALCGADTISGEAWGAWMQLQQTNFEGLASLQKVPPQDINISILNQEQVFLRFMVGATLVSAKTQWQEGAKVETWGMPLTECLSQQLGMPGATTLALPRAPKSLLLAVQGGRRLQREVSLQLFMSNAIRECRTKFGEPSIVLSSHLMESGGGEIRVSISSEFSTKDAQGFRCPLFPDDRVVDVQRMIETLVQECQVSNLRILQKVYADKEPETGLTWLFKPEAIPDDELLFV